MRVSAVDLRQVSTLAEIILRAGDVKDANARINMQRAYVRADPDYPGIVGLSTLFRAGASLDELARAGARVFRHGKLSWSIIDHLTKELAAVGYEMVLYITPNVDLPDHHTLAVAVNGVVELALSNAAADALIRALDVVDNPYRAQP